MEHHLEHLTDAPARDRFPTDPTGLRVATASPVVELEDGDTTELDVSPVAADLGGTTVRMLAYNGSLPGPTLAVRQGTAVVVRVTNHGDLETTVHWHGLRLQNRYDGVPVDTQDPIPIGGEFRYRLEFPDPGLYWYHPHVREDYTQELGLYGNILVSPADPGYWSPVDAELVLTVDDLLLEEGRVAPFSRVETSHAAMGRYGDVFLVGGRVSPRLHARAGEVTRLWLTNTANTRVFNLAVPGARMKLVGGDSGRVERQQWVTEVMLAPSERVVVDLLVDAPGEHPLQHRPPGTTRTLAVLDVADPPAEPSAAAAAFAELRTAPELVRERERLPLAAPPDKVLAFVATIDPAGPGRAGRGAHAGRGAPADHGAHSGHGGPAAPPAHAHHGSARPERDDLAGIEWEDEMAEANRALTSARVHWRVVDRTGGVDHDDIDWQLTVGDRVKIRLVNEAVSDHPMHHPFHVHGAGRFLVVARDGVEEPNLVWKDTVLVRAGEIVDIVLHVTRPGRWMAHCHIAEHLQSGMAFGFTVVSAGSGPTG